MSSRFAKRTNWSLTQNKLGAEVANRRSAGKPFIDLTESNPTRCEFEYLKQELLAPFLQGQNLCYDPNPRGAVSARRSISEYYKQKGFSVSPEQIILSASTSELYSLIFRLLVNDAETVLAPRPSYPLLEYIAGINDVELQYYRLFYDKCWMVTNFGETTKDSAKVLIVIHPNTPTGNYCTLKEQELIIKACMTLDCALIVDEVFLDYSYKIKPLSFVATEQVLTFTISGISKTLGLPHMKLAWVVVSGPEQEKRDALARLEMLSDLYLSVNIPAQNALSQWFSFQQPIQDEIKKRITKNRKALLDKFGGVESAHVLESEGGWYAVIQILEAIDDEAFSLQLLREHDVLVHPGYFFDFDEPRYVVLSLLLAPSIFVEGIQRMRDWFGRSSPSLSLPAQSRA